MLKKSLSFTAIILCMGLLNAENWKPYVHKNGYIKLGTQSDLCGDLR